MNYTNFLFALLIIFCCLIFDALIDSIEKYLYEYDFLNPFYALMYEGLFGFILSFFLFFIPNFGDDVILIYKKYSSVILKSRAKGISKLISIIDILQRKIFE